MPKPMSGGRDEHSSGSTTATRATPRFRKHGTTHASSAIADGAARAPRVSLFEEDPALAAGLDGEAHTRAAASATAALVTLQPGPWRHDDWPPSLRAGFGLLVLSGTLLRRVAVGDRVAVELLSPGDLLRPWQPDPTARYLPVQSNWQVAAPSRLAVLDLAFAQHTSEFPHISAQLAARALRRSRQLVVSMAIVQQPRIDVRLHLLLWHLAGRLGTIDRERASLPVGLTHTVLAALVAARRPTVTAALHTLEQQGQIARTTNGWILQEPPTALQIMP